MSEPPGAWDFEIRGRLTPDEARALADYLHAKYPHRSWSLRGYSPPRTVTHDVLHDSDPLKPRRHVRRVK